MWGGKAHTGALPAGEIQIVELESIGTQPPSTHSTIDVPPPVPSHEDLLTLEDDVQPAVPPAVQSEQPTAAELPARRVIEFFRTG